MRSILDLAVHEQGLRVAIFRVFGPFCRPFLVPWPYVAVTRRRGFFGTTVALRFGDHATLTLMAEVADRLARAAGPLWPEIGPVAPAASGGLARRLVKQWALMTALAAAFFTLVPLLIARGHPRPPVLVGILFPAVVLGIGALIKFWLQRDR